MDLKDKDTVLNIFNKLSSFLNNENLALGEVGQFSEEDGLFMFIIMIGKRGTTQFKTKCGDNKFNTNRRCVLTEDELETLKLMSQGLPNSKIAERLGTISINGVAKRVNAIFRKLGVNNRTEASVKAVKSGLL